MNGRHARKLRKMSNFDPHAKRNYTQFNNSNNYVLSNSGRLEKSPGTVVEITEEGEPVTKRSIYKHMKRKYYGTF